MSLNWQQVVETMDRWSRHDELWRPGQKQSLKWIGARLAQQPGVLIADEVGLGKTRLAVAVAVATSRAGGHVTILVPRGLMYQWETEFQKFHRALVGIGDGGDPAGGLVFAVRSYRDLFSAMTNGMYCRPTLPLLVSHSFGLPQYFAENSHVKRWGLPFWTRAEIERSGQARPPRALPQHLANDDAECVNQRAAARWLESAIPADLRNRILGCDQLKIGKRPDPRLFADAQAPATMIFQELIGELVGAPDLVIIDEAHKSRAGATSEHGDEAARSRLSACLSRILLHSNARGSKAKRLALTATPFELDARQWEDLLVRIGVSKSKRLKCVQAAINLASVLKNADWHAGMDITPVTAAAAHYEECFKDLVTRRRWQDHPVIQQFASLSGKGQGAAHPHRLPVRHCLSLVSMRSADKLLVAAAEAVALLAKGEEASAQEKTAGARFAQAQKIGGPVDETPISQRAAVAGPMDAKALRRAFWTKVYRRGLWEKQSLQGKPEWCLQWHPRVREAIKLVEALTRRDEKLLVFASFDAPIQAITRALNIRRYLREVAQGKPTALAVGIREDDPDFLEWCKDTELCPEPYSSARARKCHAAYIRRRERVRGHCHKFVMDRTAGVLEHDEQRRLTDWLVLHLVEQPNVNGAVQRAAEGLVQALKDKDSMAGAEDPAAEEPGSTLDWKQVVESIKEEVPETDFKNIRRSAFARQLTGSVKRAETRRTLQFLFNQPGSNPHVLVAQSAIASEGLNLHESCRRVLLFHLDWNPARIEQQIGRVDREDSLWMKTFLADRSPNNVIEIHTLTVDGTYDAHREEVIMSRAMVMKAQLFGELVEPEALALLPEELQAALRRATPNFSPGG